jgi:IS1 family transposase
MKPKKTTLTTDAFLEAVLDAGGLEAEVLAALEVKAKQLHTWLAKHNEARELALEELSERDFDTSELQFGWLRPAKTEALEDDTDANWAHYKALLEEEPKLEAAQSLESAKARTLELVAQLQAEKRAKRQVKTPRFEDAESD